MTQLKQNSFRGAVMALSAFAFTGCSPQQATDTDAPADAPSISETPIAADMTNTPDKTVPPPAPGSLELTDYLKQDCPVMKRLSHKVTGPFLTLEEYTDFFDERPMELRHNAEQMRERIVIRSDISTKVRSGLTYRTETVKGSRSEGYIRTGSYSTTKIKHFKSAYTGKNMESLWNEKCSSFLFLRTRQDRVVLHEDDYDVTYYLGRDVDETIDPADEIVGLATVREHLAADGKWEDHPAYKTVISRTCWLSGVASYDVICADHYLSTPGAKPLTAKFKLVDR